MFYVIYGGDTEKTREKSHALFDALKKKKPEASTGLISAENINAEKLEELTQTQGLFENKQIIFFDHTLENKDAREIILDKIEAITKSPNIFIFSEGKLTKDVLKKIENKAEKVQVYDTDKEIPKTSKDIFALANALGNRDKKQLWLLLREALDKGASPEEIHGMIFWKVKTMALANKSKETDVLLSKLVRMYHEAHRGKVDFEVELEKLVLDV